MADEESVIIELGIESKEFESRAVSAATTVKKLTTELDKLKKEGKQNTAQFARTDSALKESRKQYREAVKGIGQLTKIQDKNTGALEKQRLSTALLKKEYANLTEEQLENTETAEAWTKATLETNEATKRTEENIGVYTRSVGEYEKGVTSALESTGLLGGSLGQVAANFTQVKNVVNNFTQNISNSFTQVNAEINESTTNIANFGQSSATAGKSIQGIGSGAKIASGGFKILKAAIISTGIGALLIAIVALGTFFTKTKKGAEALRVGMAWMEGAFSVITGLVAKLGKFLFAAFDNPLEALKTLGEFILNNLINRFTAVIDIVVALSDIMGNLLAGDFDKVAEAAKDLGTAVIQMGTGLDELQQSQIGEFLSDTVVEINNAANAALNLEKQIIALADKTRVFQVDIARLNAEFEKQSQIAGDSTLSFKEMEEAANLARIAAEKRSKIQIELANSELVLVNERLRLARQQGLETTELLDQQAEAQKTLIDVKSNALVQEKQIATEQRQILQDRLERDLDFALDIFDNQKTINERIIADDTVTFAKRQELLAETNRLSDKSFGEQVAIIEQFAGQRIDFNSLIAESDSKVVQERIRALGLSEIIEGRALEVIRDRKTANQDLFEAEKELNAAGEEERLLAIDNEIAANEELNNTKLKQLELQLLTEGETREAIEMQLMERRIELKQQEVALLKELGQETLDAELEIAQLRAAALKKQEEEQIRSLAKQTDAVLAMASSVGDLVAKAAINGENILKEAAKATALVLIDQLEKSALAAIAEFTLREVATKGIAGFVTGAIGTVAIKALVGIAKSKISSFSGGGMAEGPSHAQGGIPFTIKGQSGMNEMEGGEAIINKKSMADPRLRNIASAINVAGGGKAFAKGDITKNYYQTGALLSPSSNVAAGANSAQVRTIINEILNNAPRPVVTVESINQAQGQLADVETQAVV